MNPILLAVILLAALGLVAGLILAIASIVMAVPVDEKAEKIKGRTLKNYYSSSRKVYEFSNLNINSEIGRLTYNIINNSPTKEKNKEEEVSSFEKDRDKKYSFKCFIKSDYYQQYFIYFCKNAQ